jgi:hypothetical protein
MAFSAIIPPRDIMPRMLPPLELGDVLRLRKPHPCGGYEWKVVRLGADIGLECTSCGRRILLPRRDLARRLKMVISDPGDDLLAP